MMERVWGTPQRLVRGDETKSLENTIYLTFDDGPDPITTPLVLDVLARRGVSATFFVVAEQARRHNAILRSILAAGHAVGNHSLDHGYRHFFSGRAKMKEWIAAAESEITRLTGAPSVGFRPPAGVRTPELAWALRELKLPLVLWRKRFYDSTIRLTPARATRSLEDTPSGSIVLLHDRQRHRNRGSFLLALDAYLEEALAQGRSPRSLRRSDLLS